MSVRVVARVRPLHQAELEKDIILQTPCSENEARPTLVRIPNPRNENETYSFHFNSVYDGAATQQDLFDSEIAPTIKHLFNGFDVTIFAYGVTGTGKTHTMRGGKSLEDRGVIPRLLSGIYRRSRKVEKDSGRESSVQVAMSYYEIYNDKVFDLFEPAGNRNLAGLPLRDVGGKTVVAGLTERPCESLKDFERLYDQANMNRSTGATKLNTHSSRSHAILCVKVAVTTGEHTRVSTASAIDLAGSEDNRRTENSKERLVESSSINKSLFVLAQCVEAISKKASRIPYRESKMTRILSLGQNNSLTIMILNLASVRYYHLDTLSSLNFANRTKKVEVGEGENDTSLIGCARPVAAATARQRQPLRTLTGATHNANVHKPSDLAAAAKGPVKPKLFSVYTDSKLESRDGLPVTGVGKRQSTLKRPSDSHVQEHRPTKSARPSIAPSKSLATISTATIEDIVERKVSELLAARGIGSRGATEPGNIDEVHRRLAALERRIENHNDDERAEGLHFLLIAKQQQTRGEDASALKMYEMARKHFPENMKLEAKIHKLQLKLREKCESAAFNALAELKTSTKFEVISRASKAGDDEADSNFNLEEMYEMEPGAGYRTKIRYDPAAPIKATAGMRRDTILTVGSGNEAAF